MKPLWNPNIPFPAFEDLKTAKDTQYFPAHTLAKEGYHFLLGAAVIRKDGALRVSFAQSLKTENDDHTRLTESVSEDGGKTWRESVIADTANGCGRSHGVYYAKDDELYVFCPRARYDRIDRYPELKMEAYRLQSDGTYQYLGVALDDDFWPMCEPITLSDGSLVMAGLKATDGTATVARCVGDDLLQWEMISIPNPQNFRYWGETTMVSRPDRLVALVRNSERIRNILVSESTDGGKTWTGLCESNFPASYSKLYAGVLSNGLSYLVFNMRDRGGTSLTATHRNTLAIAVGRDSFEKVYLLRDGFDAPPIFWRYNEWCYPYAYEDVENGTLFVAYAKNKEHCEVAALPIKNLTLDQR